MESIVQQQVLMLKPRLCLSSVCNSVNRRHRHEMYFGFSHKLPHPPTLSRKCFCPHQSLSHLMQVD